MSTIKSSYYGKVRRTAFALWRGADVVYAESGAERLGGLRVLHLGLRQEKGSTLLIESRSIYGSLDADNASEAILRGVFWDKQTIDAKNEPPIKIPAKFVQIPLAQVRQLLHEFDEIPTTIQVTPDIEGEDILVCTLRIERDAAACVFEKIWRVADGKDERLTQAWEGVWQKMGQILQTYPNFMNIEETFSKTQLEEDLYELATYQPSLILP